MKKNNKKGFILAETIAVSTVVLGALVIIYTQFISINNSYYRSFEYNSVDNLYAVNNLKTYIQSDGIDELINYLENTDNTYVNITSCENTYFTEYMYCETLIKTLNIKTAILTTEDPQPLLDFLTNKNIFSESMYSFIKSINSDNSNKYRLIVEFNDESLATLKVESSNIIVGSVVYFDPINNIACNSYKIENSEIGNLGTNGRNCLRWHVYKVEDNTYGLLLDHNVESGSATQDYDYQTDLVNAGWKVSTDSISIQDVYNIIGYYDENENSWYDYDSKHNWLGNYQHSDGVGFWVKETTPGDSSNSWIIHEGAIHISWIGMSGVAGPRPVINVSKSQIEV